MARFSIVLLALAACAPQDSREMPLDFGEVAEALPDDLLAGPGTAIDRSLTVSATPGTVVLGDAIEVVVTGAVPGQRVRIFASTDGPGISTTCPREFSGNCIEVLAPMRIGTRRADASGAAVFSGIVSDPAFTGEVWLQAAASRNVNQLILPNLSPVITVEVVEPADTGDTGTPGPSCTTDDDWWPGADLDGDGDVDLAYRVLLEVTGAGQPLERAPVTTTIDFGDVLDGLGTTGAFDPGSMRVVRQDCAAGLPEVPSQFADGLRDLDRKTDHLSAVADEVGSVVFLDDADGDLTTAESLMPGDVHRYAVYFSTVSSTGPRPLPSYVTDLEVNPGNVWTLATGETEASFEQSSGGLMRSLSHRGSPSLTSQTDSCCGNAMSFWNTTTQAGPPFGWITPQAGFGSIGIVEVGPLVTALRVSGTRNGTTDAGVDYGTYSYDNLYWMFSFRPELWHTTTQTALTDCTTEHPEDASFGFRPFQIRHSPYLINGADYTADQLAGIGSVTGVDAGIGIGVHQPPTFLARVANPVGVLIGSPNPLLDYLSIHGNELVDSSVFTPYTVPAGSRFFDNIGFVVLPFEGPWAGGAEPTLQALMEGVGVSVAGVETFVPAP